MRVTRKSLETLCANVNEARNVAGENGAWRCWRGAMGLYEVEEHRGGKATLLAAGMTASECERFLQGALAVARS